MQIIRTLALLAWLILMAHGPLPWMSDEARTFFEKVYSVQPALLDKKSNKKSPVASNPKPYPPPPIAHSR